MVEVSSHTPKGYRFDSWSGPIPRLQVQEATNLFLTLMFSFLSLPLSLRINKRVFR